MVVIGLGVSHLSVMGRSPDRTLNSRSAAKWTSPQSVPYMLLFFCILIRGLSGADGE